MIDKVNHMHQMAIGLQELWHPSTATLDIPYHPCTVDHLALIQEIGTGQVQHVIKVSCLPFVITRSSVLCRSIMI